jgi:hypothetical protein
MPDRTPTPDEGIEDAEIVEPAPPPAAPPTAPSTAPPAVATGSAVVPVPDAPPPLLPPADYDERGVPSLDYVRNKIEGRYATSLGAGELAAESAAGRDVEQQEADRAAKAREKLEEIRRSLGS